MSDDWSDSFDAALLEQRQRASESRSAAQTAEAEQSARKVEANRQCEEIFGRAAEELIAHDVGPDSRYRIAKPRFIWSNPKTLDGWHLWFAGASQVWLAVDGRAWKCSDKVEFWNHFLPFIPLKEGTRPAYTAQPGSTEPWDLIHYPEFDSDGDLAFATGGGMSERPVELVKFQPVVIAAVAKLIADEQSR